MLIDLHKLREDLKEAKIERINKTDKIRELNEKIRTKKSEQMASLKDKRLRLSSNKDKREHYGYSNQKDWNTFINSKLTGEDEGKIERAYLEGQELINSMKKEVEFFSIKISDIEWQLRIELAGLETYGLHTPEPVKSASANVTE